MKISVVIPHQHINDTVEQLLNDCIDSMEGQYDEMIVIRDNIENLSRKINKGLLLSKGDYIVVCNNDMTLEKGTLKDTCIENVVVSPYVNGVSEKLFHAHMWTIPRKVLAEVGPMCEDYDGFWFDDSDYWMRIEEKGFEIKQLKNVNIRHIHPATTLSQMPKEGRLEHNRDLFISKWGLGNYEKVMKLT